MDLFLKTMGAVNDETRVQILKFIHVHERVCVCDIESAFEMIQSRVSRHLKILKDAEFLEVRREGRWAYYSIKEPIDVFKRAILQEIVSLNIDTPSPNNECKTDDISK